MKKEGKLNNWNLKDIPVLWMFSVLSAQANLFYDCSYYILMRF